MKQDNQNKDIIEEGAELTPDEIIQTNTEEELEQEADATEENSTAELDPIAQLRAELADANDRLLRTTAEYDNFRKRSSRERENLYPEAEAGIISKVLTIYDNFDRAVEAPCTDSEYQKGMELIHQSFSEMLSTLGVEEIGKEGDSFDPALHNAVMHVEDETLGENVVAQVLQKGWKRGEKILRYAMVKTAN